MSESMKRRGMGGKDVITVGIFSAIYFVINFAFMLLGGLHPLLWILMPGFIALFTGKAREIKPATWIIVVLFALTFFLTH